jgi:mono/diheme cytochrome c family protein
VLAALPLWAILYSGAFGERKSTDTSDPVVRGAIVYRADGCSGCHGVSGQGGVGPALTNVTKTFPNFADHIAWVKNGSAALKGQPYGATGKIATGGMPNHLDMPEADLIAVVCHERVTYGKQTPPPPECVVGAPAADSTTAAGG